MNRVLRFEPWIFWAMVVANCIPVLAYRFFPTLDGPAHLYNAQLINSLVSSGSEVLSPFLEFTSDPVPNWTSHFILSFFSWFFSPALAEKILLCTYLVLFPLAFRKIIQTYNPKNIFYTYLIFPFTYNYFFILGFYNFCLSIPFLLLTIVFWKKHAAQFRGWKTMLTLGGLLALTYFSHIFVFTVLLGFIGLNLFFSLIKSIPQSQWKPVVSTGLRVLLVTSPFLLMQFIYFSIRPVGENVSYVSSAELHDWVWKMRPLLCYDFDKELPRIYILFWTIVIAAIFSFCWIVYLWLTKKEAFQFKKPISQREIFLLLAVGCLFLYFASPDGDGYVGYISLRLLLLFFVFSTIWISLLRSHVWVGVAVCLSSMYVTYELRRDNKHVAKDLSAQAVICEDIGRVLESGSVVLPLNYTSHWLMPHFSNYLGIHSSVILLENYEAATGYFPLRWKTENFPDVRLAGEHVAQNCLYWVSGDKGKTRKIDYVFVMGEIPSTADSCALRTRDMLNQHFKSVKKQGQFTLYKRK